MSNPLIPLVRRHVLIEIDLPLNISDEQAEQLIAQAIVMRFGLSVQVTSEPAPIIEQSTSSR